MQKIRWKRLFCMTLNMVQISWQFYKKGLYFIVLQRCSFLCWNINFSCGIVKKGVFFQDPNRQMETKNYIEISCLG